MMRAVVVDDEQTARTVLRSLIKEHVKELELCGEAGSIEEAVKLVNTLKPELLFLDVRLPHGSGFSILKQIDTSRLSVIFTTAHAEYALQAIKYAALDYLLKPIDPEDLKLAVRKAFQLDQRHFSARLTVLEEMLLHQKESISKIVLSDHSGFRTVLLSDILYCEGERNYTTFHLTGERKMTTSKSLIAYERMLDGTSFIRVYKSYLINLEHVSQYLRGRGGKVRMSNNVLLPVSREKKEELISRFTQR
jgi:two-component system LytT family response regulator